MFSEESAQEASDKANKVLDEKAKHTKANGYRPVKFTGKVEAIEEERGLVLVAVRPDLDEAVISLSTQANKYLIYAQGREIYTGDHIKDATRDLSLISNTKKAVETKRQEYVSPLNTQLKEISAFFKTLSDPIAEADKVTRRKVLDYNAEIERQRQEAKRIEDEKYRLAQEETELKGEHTVDLTPVDRPSETPDRVRTEVGMSSKMMVRKWELEDIHLVPEQYLKVDEVQIGKLVRAGIKEIAGIKIWEEPTLQVRSK